MESLQELADMRVTELREFITRHGRAPGAVPRLDGTPGLPRKSDLLLAAQQIWHDANQPKPSPQQLAAHSPLPADSPQRPNPFQRNPGRSPTGTSGRRRLSVAPQDHVPPAPERRQTPSSATNNASAVKPTNPSASNRGRRRSHVAINPAFSHLFTPEVNRPAAATPAAPNRLSGALNDSRVPPRRATLGPDGVPARPRIFADADVHRVPDTNQQPASTARHQSSTDSNPVPPSNTRTLKKVASVERPPPEPTKPAASATAQQTKPRSSQGTISRTSAGSSAAHAAGGSDAVPHPRFLTSLEEYLDGYDPEDDPDFNARDEDDGDSDDSFFGEAIPEFPDGVIDLSADDKQSDDQLRAHQAGQTAGSQTSEDEGMHSDAGMQSDAGSTVETDDEIVPDAFANWSRRELTTWLRNHNVEFPSAAGLTELVSRARGHALYMEANGLAPEGQEPQREQAGLRRRGVSAPTEDDGDDDVEIVAVRQSSRPAKARGPKPSGDTGQADEERGKKRHVAIFSILSLLALISLMVASSSLYHSINIPYCETVLQPGPDGKACRPCPNNGTCEDGALKCESGFIDVGGRCAEDQEFSLYADTLAGDAAGLLATVAGKQACGDDVPKFLTRSEIRETLRMEEKSRKQKRFARRRIAYKEDTFDAAIERAFAKLIEEEQFNVELGELGTLFSTKPSLSIKCKLKLLLLANLRSVVLALFVIGYVAYWRFKAARARRYRELIERHYQETLDLLRNHKIDFENKAEPHAFVKDVVLRAEILGDTNDRNIKIWKDVEKKVKADPRVIEASRKVDGMPSYTYEWAGRRRGSGYFDAGSRRGSFGSRASLDSLDLRSDDGMDIEPASPWQGFFETGGQRV